MVVAGQTCGLVDLDICWCLRVLLLVEMSKVVLLVDVDGGC